MKWIVFLLSGCALTGCFNDSLDEISPHQIIAAPENRWVHWGQQNPVDVSDKDDNSYKACQKKPID